MFSIRGKLFYDHQGYSLTHNFNREKKQAKGGFWKTSNKKTKRISNKKKY